MNKNYLFDNYPSKLIKMLTGSMIQAAIVVNVITPILFVYLLKDSVPYIHLFIWSALNLIVLYIRIKLNNKLEYYVDLDDTFNIKKYLNFYYIILISSSLLCFTIIIDGIVYGTEYLKIISMLIAIFALISGSLFTLGTVFLAFVLFLSLNYFMIIGTLLYLGGELNYVLAFLAFMLMFIVLIIGYKYYMSLYNSILAQETFERIFYKSADGMVLIKKNHFIDCNESIIKMFDVANKEEFLTINFMRYMDKRQPDGESSVKKMIRMLRLAYKKGINRFEYMHHTKHGKYFWVEIVLTKIYLQGEVLIHGSWRDISAQKELDKIKDESRKKIEKLNINLEQKVKESIDDLRKKDKVLFEQSKLASMGEMIGNIAHQWRQPLSIVSTLATSTVLQNENGMLNDEKLEKNMDIITDNVQYLSQTIDDFRNFIKHDKDKSIFDLKKTMKIFLELNSSWIQNDNLQIISNFQSNIKFEGYENELTQCFINIFNNSKDALKDLDNIDKLIFISLYIENDFIIISFKDNAGGILDKNISHVFEPYFTTKHKSQGTGIGLHMTYKIVTSMNGTIEVSNSTYTYQNHEYTGAIFTIKFPKYKEIS